MRSRCCSEYIPHASIKISMRIIRSIFLRKWYTRAIGVAFILVVISLLVDLRQFGFRPESMHKIFHGMLGAIVARYGWNDRRWWGAFPLANGAFFSFVMAFGLLFPDFGGLDAFNGTDTILHGLVGISGLIIGLSGLLLSKKFQ